MSSLREIKNRIFSIKNIWRLTSALETLSIVKMRKAQKLVLASKPFAEKIAQLLILVKEVIEKEESIFLKEREGKKLFCVVTSDRRFCGPFNQNILRFTQRKISKEKDFEVFPIGKIGLSFFKKKGYKIRYFFTGIGDLGELEEIKPISDFLIKSFFEKKFSKIFLIFTHFISPFSFSPKKIQLLPLRPEDLEVFLKEKKERKRAEVLIEPSKEYLLEEICPQLLHCIIYQSILEHNASEHAARTFAMKEASENAKKKLNELFIFYHKMRQALITRETSEIFSAKEVLQEKWAG